MDRKCPGCVFSTTAVLALWVSSEVRSFGSSFEETQDTQGQSALLHAALALTPLVVAGKVPLPFSIQCLNSCYRKRDPFCAGQLGPEPWSSSDA